jgi:hypothetical protein
MPQHSREKEKKSGILLSKKEIRVATFIETRKKKVIIQAVRKEPKESI